MATPTFTDTQIRHVIQKLRAYGITPNPQLVDQLLFRSFGSPIDNVSFNVFLNEAKPSSFPQEPPVSETPLPKEQLLLKLLKMTTSSNDGEALTAIRKVNTMLTDNGWDWDRFVAGKIKIVANPFVGLGTPNRPTPRREASPPPPPLKPTAPLAGRKAVSLGINKFADHCYCCGIEVIAQAGGFFKPADYNLNAKPANPRSQFAVICSSCDGRQLIWDQPAPPIRKRGKASINDLT